IHAGFHCLIDLHAILDRMPQEGRGLSSVFHKKADGLSSIFHRFAHRHFSHYSLLTRYPTHYAMPAYAPLPIAFYCSAAPTRSYCKKVSN
ncbi:hypothetical protein, partial [Paenibacillus dendritiformis]|uniref:hypothetical protein n=1 Tax=Paenibacillus dendritiformis TaxID=130049 RepID=UPI00387E1F61